jgi:hypothetical protein
MSRKRCRWILCGLVYKYLLSAWRGPILVSRFCLPKSLASLLTGTSCILFPYDLFFHNVSPPFSMLFLLKTSGTNSTSSFGNVMKRHSPRCLHWDQFSCSVAVPRHLEPVAHLYNIYKLISYLTGNTLCIHYKRSPINGLSGVKSWLNVAILRDIAPGGAYMNRRFGGTHNIHLQGL